MEDGLIELVCLIIWNCRGGHTMHVHRHAKLLTTAANLVVYMAYKTVS